MSNQKKMSLISLLIKEMRNVGFLLRGKEIFYKPRFCSRCNVKFKVPKGNRTTMLCEECHDKPLIETNIKQTRGFFEIYLCIKEQGYSYEDLMPIYKRITKYRRQVIPSGFLSKPKWLTKPYALNYIKDNKEEIFNEL